MNDLLSLLGWSNLRGAWNRHYYCREYCGPCPFGCGASDAFHVYNEVNMVPGVGYLGLYLCMGSKQGRNGCGRSGHMIDYIKWRDQVDFHDACERLGIDAGVVLNYWREQQGKAPIDIRTYRKRRQRALGESDIWQTTAWALLRNATHLLKGDPLDYLLERGLTPETINAAALAYYPRYKRVCVDTWGYEYKKGERPFSINIPRGVVIPWFDRKGAVICLRFRRLPGDESREAREVYGVEKTGEIRRYRSLYGSCTHLLYGIDKLRPDIDVALMEGELDTLTGSQTGVCACVATGSTTGCRHSEESLTALGMCRQVLVAYDNDAAGEKAAGYWLGELSNTRRWRPFWKDTNAMQAEGIDVTAWLRLGLDIGQERQTTIASASSTDTPKKVTIII